MGRKFPEGGAMLQMILGYYFIAGGVLFAFVTGSRISEGIGMVLIGLLGSLVSLGSGLILTQWCK